MILYIDAHNILESFAGYPDIPQTFDGSLPSECFDGESKRIVIGERYFFQDEGYFATVTTATVDETNRKLIIGTDTGHVLTGSMSDSEFEDYKKYPDAYFGVIQKQGKNSENDYDFFENWVDIHMSYSKESTLKKLEISHDYERLKLLNKEELVVEYCERFMGVIIDRKKGTA